MKPITRRNFMKKSMAAGVGLAMASPFSRARGANNDIRVAVMGINGRGGSVPFEEYMDLALYPPVHGY